MTDQAELPIGVFDSGIGGLTVVRQIHRVLPRGGFDLSRRYSTGPAARNPPAPSYDLRARTLGFCSNRMLRRSWSRATPPPPGRCRHSNGPLTYPSSASFCRARDAAARRTRNRRALSHWNERDHPQPGLQQAILARDDAARSSHAPVPCWCRWSKKAGFRTRSPSSS
jgi:hypothetical protein